MASQKIKYQGTTVEATKSAQELCGLVQKYGGTRFEMQWKDGLLSGVRFALKHEKLGQIPVRLEARITKIEDLLYRLTSMSREKSKEQAYRIAWRQLKDFVEQQLLAIETGLFPVHEVFMAQVETRDPVSGELVTMGDLLERHAAIAPGGGIRLLPAPPTLDADFEVEA